MSDNTSFEIVQLGENNVDSPLKLSKVRGEGIYNYVKVGERYLLDNSREYFDRCIREGVEPICLEKAGPREKIFFEPTRVRAAIVTCGGLCPGINNVIRGIVMALHYFYGVREIFGVPYGYEGLNPAFGHKLRKLTPDDVKDIHHDGGTYLGSSRGAQPVEIMVDFLRENKIDMLFGIGGDGTLKGLQAISERIQELRLPISIIGIPKTIDNDIDVIDHSFGFETSFDKANPILRDAHNEAAGAYNGIAVIKLMGRDSGFIAACAAISQPVVNFVLIPEMHFELYGENGFMHHLTKRLEYKHHAVIVVAEGAGQHLFEEDNELRDASGNLRHQDIGILLTDKIKEYYKGKMPITVKYIDPSYIVRSAAANSSDSVYCSALAYHAVHAAMAGKTQCVIGQFNNKYCYAPIRELTRKRRKVDLEGDLWFSVLQSTGQPFRMY